MTTRTDYDLADSPDFALRIHDFDWEIQGNTVFQLEASGRFTHIYPTVEREPGEPGRLEWHEITATIDESRVRSLREVLIREDFPGLDGRYAEEGVEDGAITTFWLRSGGKVKQVYCQNRYPEAASTAFAWMRQTASHLGQDARPRPLSDEEVRRRWEQTF